MFEHTDWVRGRIQKRKDRLGREKLSAQWLVNARNSYDSMVQNLRGSVEACVQEYNSQTSDRDCKAEFKPSTDGAFSVSCQGRLLRVLKNEGTVITFEITSQSGDVPFFGALEVAADINGNVRYKHKEDLLELNDAAHLVLDGILCS